MINRCRTLSIILVMVVSALVAPAIMMMKSDHQASWLEFIGWAIFFSSLNVPFLFTRSDSRCCGSRLLRFLKGE